MLKGSSSKLSGSRRPGYRRLCLDFMSHPSSSSGLRRRLSLRTKFCSLPPVLAPETRLFRMAAYQSHRQVFAPRSRAVVILSSISQKRPTRFSHPSHHEVTKSCFCLLETCSWPKRSASRCCISELCLIE